MPDTNRTVEIDDARRGSWSWLKRGEDAEPHEPGGERPRAGRDMGVSVVSGRRDHEFGRQNSSARIRRRNSDAAQSIAVLDDDLIGVAAPEPTAIKVPRPDNEEPTARSIGAENAKRPDRVVPVGAVSLRRRGDVD